MLWGAELGERDLPGLIASADPAVMFSSFDAPRSFSVIADRSSGWSGTPAVELSSDSFALDDDGILRVRPSVRSLGPGHVDVHALRVLLPLSARAGETLDFTGRWSGERRPQQAELRDGTRSRQTRRGRPGHDAPYLTIVGTPGFGFRGGELWAAA